VGERRHHGRGRPRHRGDLEEVGTPDDIDGAAREGFEVFVEALDEAVADESSLAEIYGIDEDDAASILALFEYANTTCLETV
jgi:hypothetical protein